MLNMLVLYAVIFLAAIGFHSYRAYGENDYTWDWNQSSTQNDQGSEKVSFLLKAKSHVEIHEAFVYLRDLAECYGIDDLCKKVISTRLFPSPAPGQRKIMEKSSLERLLSGQLAEKDWKLAGALQVNIIAAEFKYDQSEIVRSFKELLEQSALQGPQIRICLEHIQATGPINLRSGSYSIDFAAWHKEEARGLAWIQNRYRNAQRLSLHFVHESGDEEKSVPFEVLLKLRVEAKLFLAQNHLKAKEFLFRDDFTEDWKKVDGPIDQYITDFSEAEGLVLKSSLALGQALKPAQLMRPLAIRRGESVEMELEKGTLILAGKVKALGEGSVGDNIDVLLQETRKRLSARIIGPGKVRVAF